MRPLSLYHSEKEPARLGTFSSRCVVTPQPSPARPDPQSVRHICFRTVAGLSPVLERADSGLTLWQKPPPPQV